MSWLWLRHVDVDQSVVGTRDRVSPIIAFVFIIRKHTVSFHALQLQIFVAVQERRAQQPGFCVRAPIVDFAHATDQGTDAPDPTANGPAGGLGLGCPLCLLRSNAAAEERSQRGQAPGDDADARLNDRPAGRATIFLLAVVLSYFCIPYTLHSHRCLVQRVFQASLVNVVETDEEGDSSTVG